MRKFNGKKLADEVKRKNGMGFDSKREADNLPHDLIEEITADLEANTINEEADNMTAQTTATCNKELEEDNDSKSNVGNVNKDFTFDISDLENILNKRQLANAEEELGEKTISQDNLEVLKDVKYIGPKTMERIRDYINDSSSENSVNKSEKKDNTDIKSKAKSLARKIRAESDDKTSKKSTNRRNKEYFPVDIDIKADIRGVKYRNHAGIEIADFEHVISTDTNHATYNFCEVYEGNENDNFDIWGRYSGTMKEKVNGKNIAQFEFYLRGNNLTVTYWQGYYYKREAKMLAQRAIDVFKNIRKNN